MKILACAILVLAVACGGNHNNGDDQTGDDAMGGDDGGGTGGDAKVPPGCTPAAVPTQCSDCIDNDNDGYVDSFDLECTGLLDNDESSFATGIPGDNIDPVQQDCFFDGNSGAGNDGCNIHVCCLLGAMTPADCPIGANKYNPNDCPPPIGTGTISQMCKDVCGKLTPPGCDCFGCCTLCDPVTNVCRDIATNPNTSPGCDLAHILDPNICKSCTKITDCGNTTCGGTSCILCPGQDPSDLPASCGGMTSCPMGTTSCANGAACPAQTYCDASSMCCVGLIF
jgi:hypothetical protein